MNLRFLLALGLSSLLLSGCFGYAPGTARPGDQVVVLYTATDLATGEVLASNVTATFTLGGNAGGLGFDVDGALVGHKVNDTLMVRSPTDAGRSYTGTQQTFNRTLPAVDVVHDATQAQFVSAFGAPAHVGQSFAAGSPWNETVTAVDGENVTYRDDIPAGFVIPYPTVGVDLRYDVVGDQALRTLDPRTGATFALGADNPFGFPEGAYRTAGATPQEILFDFSPSSAPQLIGHGVQFHLVVLAVGPGPAGAPSDGGYGQRHSPVVAGAQPFA